MIPTSILLNGKKINSENLSEIDNDAIRQFLSEWWNNNAYIEQKTSGSTGIPKQIKIRKENMINSAMATLNYFNLQPGQTALLCLPVEFIAGKMMIVRAIVGSLQVDYSRFDLDPLKEIPIDKKYDFCAMVPLQVEHSITNRKNQFENIKTIIIGGAEISSSLRLKILQSKNNCYATFGMTETITHIAIQKIELKNKEQIFQVLKGIQINQDERSCLTINAPGICEEVITTNDVVEITDFDKFRWLGRADNIINSGGLKIHPEELEKLISEIITDRNFFVYGKPNELLGEELVLIIEGEPYDLTTENLLINYLQKNTSKNKVPKKIYYHQHFINTDTGKLKRNDTANACFSNN